MHRPKLVYGFLILIWVILSFVSTFMSYYYYFSFGSFDGSNYHRGFPLPWVVEKHGLYDAGFYFEPMNFLHDLAYWFIVLLLVLLLPSLLFLYLREVHKRRKTT